MPENTAKRETDADCHTDAADEHTCGDAGGKPTVSDGGVAWAIKQSRALIDESLRILEESRQKSTKS